MNPNVTYRSYQGTPDILKMLAVHEACRETDCVDHYSVAYRVPNMTSLEYEADVALSMTDGTDRNVLVAEIDGMMVAHARIEWWREWDNERKGDKFAYLIRAWVAPEWRKNGIGSYLLQWGEGRARELDSNQAIQGELAANATDNEINAIRLLEKAGYTIRFLSPELAYDDVSVIPAPVTPKGYEVTPLDAIDHRAVAEALVAANAHPDLTVSQLEEWITKEAPGYLGFIEGCDPTISRTAWKDGQVVGLYLCRRKDNVGDVANVAVAREHRMLGLSRALMFHCLHAMRETGIERARVFTGIGADRDAPPEGPYKMYLGFGFGLLTFHNRYRKSMAG